MFCPRPAKLKPLTLEAMPEVTDGGRTYTLRVKKGIFFTDDPAFEGRKRELTAADYDFTLKRLMDPRVSSPNLWLIEGRIAGVPEAIARILRGVGSPPPAKGAPVLAFDLDGPGRDALLYRPERAELLVASVLAPPVGDTLTLAARARGQAAPVEGFATVTEVVARGAASPGRPAGFTLRIEGPTALHELLAARVPQSSPGEKRAAPRIAVKAPVKVKPADERPAPTPARPLHARIEYATEQELAADWIENLSHGGAFVRTATPRPEGTRLVLDLTLPDGIQLAAQAVVTSVSPRGMGVRFVLTPEQDAVLAAAMARISARPRRALVVDDVALVRQMLADALAARGFEVLAAADANEGIRRLSEELMALDLLVTDVRMPGMSGEELVRFIRKAGGEGDLTIVAVTGRMDPETEAKLVCLRALASKGLMRTRRCTPDSPRR